MLIRDSVHKSWLVVPLFQIFGQNVYKCCLKDHIFGPRNYKNSEILEGNIINVMFPICQLQIQNGSIFITFIEVLQHKVNIIYHNFNAIFMPGTAISVNIYIAKISQTLQWVKIVNKQLGKCFYITVVLSGLFLYIFLSERANNCLFTNPVVLTLMTSMILEQMLGWQNVVWHWSSFLIVL